MRYCRQDFQSESGGTIWLYPQKVEGNKPLLRKVYLRGMKRHFSIAYLSLQLILQFFQFKKAEYSLLEILSSNLSNLKKNKHLLKKV